MAQRQGLNDKLALLACLYVRFSIRAIGTAKYIMYERNAMREIETEWDQASASVCVCGSVRKKNGSANEQKGKNKKKPTRQYRRDDVWSYTEHLLCERNALISPFNGTRVCDRLR